jgi:hypothetical protein
MSILEAIAAQRQMLLDGIEANEGDINLRIFEDFYPDEAHFIYELLQNAEDTGATEVAFELTEDACYFEHNGPRHFNEADIRGITGIFNSSKKDNPDKIGKFGVGFKSVFVYTDTPIIYSTEYSFKILKLVLPEPVKARDELAGRTRFEFPFNNPKKDSTAAFSEIKAGLEQLSETTLLFLNNLRYIKWKIGFHEGAVLREEHSASHLEVLKLVDGKEVLTSHWLRFAVPVQNIDKFKSVAEGVARQKVAVAFELAFSGDEKSFDRTKALASQLRIVPAVRGKVAVFFPAEKETSGLRFHVHAPFIPELSRASIKNSPENYPLFEQLAVVAAKSLHQIKDLGLLTGEFLAVLPNNDDSLPERYALIRKAIIAEMRCEALVPAYGGGFAPSIQLLQGRASIKMLLSSEDIAFITQRDDDALWAIGATQKNSNQDRFLSSLGLKSFDARELKDFFENRATTDDEDSDSSTLDAEVASWLISKPFEWLQALYAILYRYCEETGDYGDLEDVYFIKLTGGRLGTPRSAYFQSGPESADDPLFRVDDGVFSAGAKKAQQTDARKFLEKLGVRVPTELDDLHQLLHARYGLEGDPPTNKIYAADLERMISFSERNPQSRHIFDDAIIFKIDSPDYDWGTSKDVFLDLPFVKTGLNVLHEAAGDKSDRRWPLSDWYATCGIPSEKIARFAEYAGCQKEFGKISKPVSCVQNPNWHYLREVPGDRFGNVINRDFDLSSEALSLLNVKQEAASLLVWQALCRADGIRPSHLHACYQKNDRGGSRLSDSQLVFALKEMAWVPLVNGQFVMPREASAADLPKGFTVDKEYRWLEALKFGEEEKARESESAGRALHRAELGFGSEDELKDAQAFAKLPKSERERMLAQFAAAQPEPIELPEKSAANSKLRAGRIVQQARATPDKSSVIKSRSIQEGVEVVKASAKLYLMNQYTNRAGQMICQACKGELPFKLAHGAYFFETVEIVVQAQKRFREGYLALCPNHAAAYQFANAQRNSMHELVATASGNELAIALGGIETSLYFTQMHLADVQVCLESIDDDGN